MEDKQLVSLETKYCAVCGQEYQTGDLYLQTRSLDKPNLNSTTVAGWGMCPEHTRLYDEGYIALVEARNDGEAQLRADTAYRLGRLAHLKFEVFDQLFAISLPDNVDGTRFPLVFVAPETMDYLETLLPPPADE